MPSIHPAVPRSARGRARRELLLDTAQRLFVAQGYDSTSINQVVAEAGGSLSTAYQMFGNKQGLLRAVVMRIAENVRAQVLRPETLALPPAQALPLLARQMLVRSVDDQLIQLNRLLIAESERLPQLSLEIIDFIERYGLGPLTAYFRACDRRGELRVAAPRLTAMLFLQICKSWRQHALLLGVGKAPSSGELTRMVDTSVALFLRGLAHPDNPRRAAERGETP